MFVPRYKLRSGDRFPGNRLRANRNAPRQLLREPSHRHLRKSRIFYRSYSDAFEPPGAGDRDPFDSRLWLTALLYPSKAIDV